MSNHEQEKFITMLTDIQKIPSIDKKLSNEKKTTPTENYRSLSASALTNTPSNDQKISSIKFSPLINSHSVEEMNANSFMVSKSIDTISSGKKSIKNAPIKSSKSADGADMGELRIESHRSKANNSIKNQSTSPIKKISTHDSKKFLNHNNHKKNVLDNNQKKNSSDNNNDHLIDINEQTSDTESPRENVIDGNTNEINNTNDTIINVDNTISSSNANTNRVVDLSQPWNTLLSLQLKKFGEKAVAFKWCHDFESNYLESCENFYSNSEMILQAVLGTVTGGFFISFVSDMSIGRAGLIILFVIQIILVLTWSIIYGLRGSGNFIRTANNHKYMSIKFNELYLDIQGQFILPVAKRREDIGFFWDISKKFNEYLFTAPSIRKTTENLYLTASENGDIFQPIVLGGTDKVEIVINNGSPDIRVLPQDESDMSKNYDQKNREQNDIQTSDQLYPQGLPKQKNSPHNRSKFFGKNMGKNMGKSQYQLKKSSDKDNDKDIDYATAYEIDRWLKNF